MLPTTVPPSAPRTAGIVPTAIYRHFNDMDELGLALDSEFG